MMRYWSLCRTTANDITESLCRAIANDVLERSQVFICSRPACSETDHRVRIVRLLPEAIFDLIFEHLKHTVFQYDEFLVGRRIKIELESIILKNLLQLFSHFYSVLSDFHIQSVCLTLLIRCHLEQSLELYAEQPALGEQRAMLFH